MPPLHGPLLTANLDVRDLPEQHRMAFCLALGAAAAAVVNSITALAIVSPGIPTTLAGMAPGTPGAMTHGVTVGMGNVVVQPFMSPVVSQTITGHLAALKLDAPQKALLVSMMTKALEIAHRALSAGTMVLPGIPVSMSMTLAPGKLQAPQLGAVEALINAELMSMDPKSWIPPAPMFGNMGQLGCCLPKKPSTVIAKLIGNAMKTMVDMTQVQPGIAIANGMTVAPGRLA
jgi:hypothetical protein